jgi:hypothetical protein
MKQQGVLALILVLLTALCACHANGSSVLTTTSLEQKSAETAMSMNIQTDMVSGYLFVIEYLATTERDIRDMPLMKYLAVDTSKLVGLTAEEKTHLLAELEKYQLKILDKTFTELVAEGYIKKAAYEFENGAFIEIKNISIKGSTMTMDAFIFFAGLNGWGLLDFDITYDGSNWSISRTKITVKS